MSTKTDLKPVGQRPRCQHCNRELKPNFKWDPVPYNIQTDKEREDWRKQNPRQFLGTYGSYSDDLFCGLRCGYHWAVKMARAVGGNQGIMKIADRLTNPNQRIRPNG